MKTLLHSGIWKEIPANEAEKHSLYGLDGGAAWLMILLVLHGLSVGSQKSMFFLQYNQSGLTLLSFIITIIGSLYCTYLLYTKSYNFQRNLTICLAGQILIYFIIYTSFNASADFMSRHLLGHFVGPYLLFLLYAWESERIHVTCCNRVKEAKPASNPQIKTSDKEREKSSEPSSSKIQPSSTKRTTTKTKKPVNKSTAKTRSSDSDQVVTGTSEDDEILEPIQQVETAPEPHSNSIQQRLESLKTLEEQGLIDADQAKKKRDEILENL
jgi:hypothetical protein